MDYLQQSLVFRSAKALRYTRLYGPRRTLVKIDSQFHMQRGRNSLVLPQARRRAGAHVGIIGCGKFAYSTVAHFLLRNNGSVIRGVMDPNAERARSFARRYGAHFHTADAERVLSDSAIDLVYVASNHATHAEYAIRALEAGKNVHIEKPHVVTDQQLRQLCAAMESSAGKVNLGFNRPNSTIGSHISNALASEPGASMLNWFVAGHQLEPDHWYYRESEGGRVLGNLCHWTDFVLGLVPAENRYPLVVTPTRAAQSDCDIVVTYRFADGSIAVISFSAKGHVFEGVKERFAAQKGDVLLTMDDFRSLRVETGSQVKTIRHRYREHGHEANIQRSYAMSRGVVPAFGGLDPSRVFETGDLFLRTREALERNEALTLTGEQFSARDPQAVLDATS